MEIFISAYQYNDSLGKRIWLSGTNLKSGMGVIHPPTIQNLPFRSEKMADTPVKLTDVMSLLVVYPRADQYRTKEVSIHPLRKT